MKKHSHILEVFSIKGRSEEGSNTASAEDPAVQELLDAKLLSQSVDTDGVKRYWLTHSGKTYLKSEKDLYKHYNMVEAYKSSIKAEFLSLIFANPFVTVVIFISVPIVIIYMLSIGVFQGIEFLASIIDWFNALMMSWADWLNENFADLLW